MEFNKETRYFLDAVAQLCQIHGIEAINIDNDNNKIRAIKKSGGSIEFTMMQDNVYYGATENREMQTYHAEMGDEF